MNHNQDIDNGLEEYLDATTREQDEAAFVCQPGIFSGDLGQEGDGAPFTCTCILSLHLTGDKFDRRHHPFAYDGGFAELAGHHNGDPVRITFRWVGTTIDTTIERFG